MDDFEIINAQLVQDLQSDPYYNTQLDGIFSQEYCDCSYGFLGFVDHYYYLSKIIPEGRTVYDFGCCYAFQAWYFRNHKKYIGIDPNTQVFLNTPNSEYHKVTTEGFLATMAKEEPSFAICNYVPPWHGHDSQDLVRAAFKHCFVFYIENGDHPEW